MLAGPSALPRSGGHRRNPTGRRATALVPATSNNKFATGTSPFGICFDGYAVYVSNFQSNTITKLQAGDGDEIGTFTSGKPPVGIACDGANVWVANFTDNTVSKLRVAATV